MDLAAPFAMSAVHSSVLRNANARLRNTSPVIRPSTGRPGFTRPIDRDTGVAALPAAKLRYVASLARRKANVERFAANIGKDDPETAREFRAFFAANDFFGKLNRAVSPVGYSVDNVGDALAAWWLGSWQLANQDYSEDGRLAKLRAVKRQAAEMVLTTPAFANADDATKQELAEALWIFAAANEDFVKQAEADPRAAAKIAVAARQGALRMGMDMTAMTLTNDGFVMRR